MWLDEIAYFEALFSISTFAYNNPTYTLPGLDKKPGITGQNIRHPFIPEDENIGNPLQFAPPLKVILLTGSNWPEKALFSEHWVSNRFLPWPGTFVRPNDSIP